MAKGAVADMVSIPDEYVGLWRRDSLMQPTGSRDVTTEVYWLQSHGLYVDLRIPKDRPDFGGYRSLQALPQGHLDWLKSQEGFAGRLLVNDRICHWRRDLDFQPPGSFDDIGEAHFIGDSVLLESGVFTDYAEIWQRSVLNGNGQILAARALPGEQGRLGFWVVVGDYFMYAIDRLAPFPAVDDVGEGEAFDGIWMRPDFDCEIGFGRIHGSRPWRIERCSLPFREGDCLFETMQPELPQEGVVWQPPLGSILEKASDRWRVEECTLDPSLFMTLAMEYRN